MIGMLHPVTRHRSGKDDLVIQGRLDGLSKKGFFQTGADVQKGDQVKDSDKFGGQTWTIVSVTAVPGATGIHHLEAKIRVLDAN